MKAQPDVHSMRHMMRYKVSQVGVSDRAVIRFIK
jgi:hypothetical protein